MFYNMFPCIMTKLILSGHGKSLPLQPSKTIFFTLRFFTCRNLSKGCDRGGYHPFFNSIARWLTVSGRLVIGQLSEGGASAVSVALLEREIAADDNHELRAYDAIEAQILPAAQEVWSENGGHQGQINQQERGNEYVSFYFFHLSLFFSGVSPAPWLSAGLSSAISLR